MIRFLEYFPVGKSRRRRREPSGIEILGWNILEITMDHPFKYAKVLMQIGYEPFPPKMDSFFGKPYLALPNTFQYVDYISSVDGVLGCFRGLLPNFYCRAVQYIATRIMMRMFYDLEFPKPKRKLIKHPLENALEYLQTGRISRLNLQEEEFSEDELDIRFNLKKLALRLVCTTYGVFASHPFYVIMIRTMAEFVGRENKYVSMRASFLEIQRQSGPGGFFKGILARLVSVYISVIAPAVALFLYAKIRNRKNWLLERFIVKSAGEISTRLSSQFDVVANVRAVNNSGLLIGQPPYTAFYQNSLDCWRQLRDANQLNRGYFKLWRMYTGPTIQVNGNLEPVGHIFGPIHEPL